MKLEKQVTSLELSKKLKKLGVEQNGYFDWMKGGIVAESGVYSGKICSAFTPAELGKVLPEYIEKGDYVYYQSTYKLEGKWNCAFSETEGRLDFPETRDKTEANARAIMLIYLIENKLLVIKGGARE